MRARSGKNVLQKGGFMKKDNIRSFRFSDEVLELLEGFEGKNLNEKFNNMVICFSKGNFKENLELAGLEKRIEQLNFAIYEKYVNGPNNRNNNLLIKLREDYPELEPLLIFKIYVNALKDKSLAYDEFEPYITGIINDCIVKGIKTYKQFINFEIAV